MKSSNVKSLSPFTTFDFKLGGDLTFLPAIKHDFNLTVKVHVKYFKC